MSRRRAAVVLLGTAVAVLAAAGAMGGSGDAAGRPTDNVPVLVLSLRGPIVYPPWTPVTAPTLDLLRGRMASVFAGGCDLRCWPDATVPDRPSLLISGPFLDDGCAGIDAVGGELLLAASNAPGTGPDARLVLTATSRDCVSDTDHASSLAQAPQVLVAVPLDALPQNGTLAVQCVGAGSGSVYAQATVTIPDGEPANARHDSAPRTPAQ